MKTIEKFLNINYNIEVKKVLDKINSLKFYAKLYFFYEGLFKGLFLMCFYKYICIQDTIVEKQTNRMTK